MKMKKMPFPSALLHRSRDMDEHVLLETEQKFILTDKSDFFIREAYKTLRTNVTFALAGEDGGKVLMVTSAMKSEGKSITSLNLAISYAQMNKRVLLIDCDLRRPKLSRLLDIRSSVGLSNVLVSPELKGKAILDSKIPGLQVLLAGDVPPNPSELLGSSRMKALLEALQQQYDYVFIDTPPLGVVADALVLVPQSAGAVLVARHKQTTYDELEEAIEGIQRINGTMLGVVLSDVQPQKGAYAGYEKRRYYRDYNYEYSSKSKTGN